MSKNVQIWLKLCTKKGVSNLMPTPDFSEFYRGRNSLSGWQDLNLRPPAPKAGALTGLRYTPKS